MEMKNRRTQRQVLVINVFMCVYVYNNVALQHIISFTLVMGGGVVKIEMCLRFTSKYAKTLILLKNNLSMYSVKPSTLVLQFARLMWN